MTMQKAVPVPHHLEDTVATIAALHAAHDREAHALQKAVSRATGGIARPVTLILITTAIAAWVRSISRYLSSDTRHSIRIRSHSCLQPFRL
jgi:hypothetical protein